MPPVGGKLTVELRIVHQRSRLLRGGGARRADVRFYGPTAPVQVCATQTPRLPTVAAKKIG